MEQSTKKNPYDWINPVQSKDIFAGRSEEISRIMEELTRLKGDNQISPGVAIIGERRVGKTSLLRRLDESCKEHSLISLIVNIDDRMANDVWEFWKEIFYSLLSATQAVGINLVSDQRRQMGFIVQPSARSDPSTSLIIDDLKFITLYQIHLSAPQSVTLAYEIIKNDLYEFREKFKNAGYDGIVLMLDEAHNLLDSKEVKQYLRNIIQQASGYGIVFSGETSIGRLFTDTAEPFFGQAHVIRLDNFVKLNDVVECALLPLDEGELKLISPMTINYLAKLSRGKPNQIRLICSSIYRRFMQGAQDDLNITIDVLDDVLDDISNVYRDTDLKDLVGAIQRLDGVNLEILHNMTRYPDWSLQDIINLDESFRGESKSDLAIERRRRMLEAKKQDFMKIGLMEQSENLYQPSGGEFLSLYLRFFYETRKYGELSRKIILGHGPPTLFGETTEKLVRSLAYNFGQDLELQRLIFHQYHRDFGFIIDTIKRRFAVLEDLKKRKKPEYDDANDLISECFAVCELIGKEGEYYLLCLSVRNRDNPRELIQIELYFDIHDKLLIDLPSLFNLLNKQAEEARVLIEGYHGFWVKLPDLSGLLKTTGFTIDKLVENVSLVPKWWLSSIQHAINYRKEKERTENKNEAEQEDRKNEDKRDNWVTLYGKGEVEKAETHLSEEIDKTQARNKRARLYNDLGYIRSRQPGGQFDLAGKDLEAALDLHFAHLQLTLLNLSYLDIKNNDHEKAMEKIEAALLLSLSPIEINASYLRLCVPEYKLGFNNNWEQHPANVIEAAYINLAYALLKTQKYEEASSTLKEGLEIMPSSVRIKHALARFYLYRRNAQLAYPIYKELGEVTSLLDEATKREVRYFDSASRRRRKKSTKRKRK